ncbi:MAG TPA: FlgO family outer membrane protein [Deltaproteobacteria bacterium]|nr:FlgO family outer membrane protein [Deltaproteobacteria bacterium]HPL86843.1 FlgO family outer membrane protein [Deltaproteobacteria bacterium]
MKLGPFLAVILLSAGCCHLYPGNAGTMEACAGRIAESLARGLDGSCMGVNVLVSTPVESVSLAPSGFGLALQELLIGALVEKKVNVVDVQLRPEPYIVCDKGLMSLSRDAGRVRNEFRAEIIIVSTYLVRDENIVITSRAVDYTSNDVIASATVVLAKTADVRRLLKNRERAALYEK